MTEINYITQNGQQINFKDAAGREILTQKQPKLKAGNGISISEDGVISCNGSSGQAAAPYCYALNTYDSDNIIVCDGEAEFVSGIYFNNGDDDEQWAIDNFVFDYGGPKLYYGGRTILQEWRSTSGYAHIIPNNGNNPHHLGWYEYNSQDQDYVGTEDVEVDPSKNYYIGIYTGLNIHSVVFSNNGAEYIITGGENETMYNFKEGQIPLNV